MRNIRCSIWNADFGVFYWISIKLGFRSRKLKKSDFGTRTSVFNGRQHNSELGLRNVGILESRTSELELRALMSANTIRNSECFQTMHSDTQLFTVINIIGLYSCCSYGHTCAVIPEVRDLTSDIRYLARFTVSQILETLRDIRY